MLKRLYVVLIIFFAMFCAASCVSNDIVRNTTLPGVIVARGDGNGGVLTVYVDGKKHVGRLKASGKWGVVLPNGRHSIKLHYSKNDMYSKSLDFWIKNSRLNLTAMAFENAEPTVNW